MRVLLILAIAILPTASLAGGSTGRAAGFGGSSSSIGNTLTRSQLPPSRIGNYAVRSNTSTARVPLRAIRNSVSSYPSVATYGSPYGTFSSNPWD